MIAGATVLRGSVSPCEGGADGVIVGSTKGGVDRLGDGCADRRVVGGPVGREPDSLGVDVGTRDGSNEVMGCCDGEMGEIDDGKGVGYGLLIAGMSVAERSKPVVTAAVMAM